MIIWINGTFGSGKTTAAYELQRRLRDSFVYDPERFGFVFMENVPKEIAESDFQDYPLWREANYQLLKQLADQYHGTIIVPMTLTNEAYFQEIVGRLRDSSIEVKHFTLMASQRTILKRLRKRLEGEKSWAYQQMKARLSQLRSTTFHTHIETDAKSIDEVVETIARLSGARLLPDNRSRLRKVVDRIKISLKEIRLLK
ncbi:AAA family ATPase [Ornithinibacillus salinisoli]|uniref:AAA family ATPase n=1 Tax=Ornithinibacillus salinisoli TaxID=1848459 RepID=A0ABW4VU84_9BACI